MPVSKTKNQKTNSPGAVQANTKKTEEKIKKVENKSLDVKKEKPIKTKSLSLDVFGKDGKVTGKLELPGEIFGVKVNKGLLAQAVRVHLSNQRAGSANTKTRGEVRGSTRKIYRQKGTGRARHGAITAPIFVGGGISFGPRAHGFELKMPKNMRRKALFSALSLKMSEGKIIILDSAGFEGKTKEAFVFMKSQNLIGKKGDAKKVLFVSSNSQSAERAVKNIGGLDIAKARSINTYVVLNSNHLVLVKDAVEEIKETFLKEKVNK